MADRGTYCSTVGGCESEHDAFHAGNVADVSPEHDEIVEPGARCRGGDTCRKRLRGA